MEKFKAHSHSLHLIGHRTIFICHFLKGSKAYIVGADGSGLHQLPPMGEMSISNMVWSPDQKSIYVSAGENSATTNAILEMERGRLDAGEVGGKMRQCF